MYDVKLMEIIRCLVIKEQLNDVQNTTHPGDFNAALATNLRRDYFSSFSSPSPTPVANHTFLSIFCFCLSSSSSSASINNSLATYYTYHSTEIRTCTWISTRILARKIILHWTINSALQSFEIQVLLLKSLHLSFSSYVFFRVRSGD